MSERNQSSTSESLAEALSRVIVTRDGFEDNDPYQWATQHGRGDRMPRFLERAIENVPHAAARPQTRQISQQRHREPTTRSRVMVLMSVAVAGLGVGINYVEPAALQPVFTTTQALIATTMFAQPAHAATPRLAFGQVLRNYSLAAAEQASRANIIVRDIAPGTTLSAGEPVSATEWTLPQSGLDNLVITFPRGVAPDEMRATVEIPGNAQATSGTFSVELRQAPSETGSGDAVETTSATPQAPIEVAPVAVQRPEPIEVRKARASDRSNDDDDKPAVSKRKNKPSASVTPKRPLKAVASVSPPAAAPEQPEEEPTLLSKIFPSVNAAAASPNETTMFNLGGPFAPQ